MENALSGSMRNFLYSFLCLFLFVSTVAFAEPATVVTEGAIVYDKPDFDAEQLYHLSSGEKIEVSQRAFGPFHRLRTQSGKIGFIADNDYLIGKPAKKSNTNNGKLTPLPETSGKLSDPEPVQASSQKAEKKSEKAKKLPFTRTRYRGASLSYMGYREQTMGGQPLSSSVFYGFKMYGPNLVVDGDMVTEVNIDVLPSAPVFYQEGTGNSATGWIFHTDLLFDSVFPQGKDVMTFFGFGPMFKYDHYNVSLGTKKTAYDIEDMIFGAVFELGVGLRIGSAALRAEFKYDWEKTQYWGLGTSLLFPF
jgi:hypothetical protein